MPIVDLLYILNPQLLNTTTKNDDFFIKYSNFIVLPSDLFENTI